MDNTEKLSGLFTYMSLLTKFYDVCDAEIAEDVEEILFDVCDAIEDELGMWEDFK